MDLGQYEYFKQKYKDIEKKGICEYKEYYNCENNKPRWITAATRYHFDIYDFLKWKENPNRDLFLCQECEEEYYAHWEEMWTEYYAGCM